MPKLLIVSTKNNKESQLTGGNVVIKRNIDIFTNAFAANNTDTYFIEYYQSKALSFLYSFFGFSDGLTPAIMKDLEKRSLNYDYVFFNTTRLGCALRRISRYSNTLVFAHNAEFEFTKQYLRSMGLLQKLLHLPLLYSVFSNEKKSLKYAKLLFALNQRDSDAFFKRYSRKADYFLPISFRDTFYCNRKLNPAEDRFLLFVGSDFYGNTEGLFWFIENVLEELPITLKVVGSGMDAYKGKYPDKKVEFLGFIADLNTFYNLALAVILPIFSGSGMKTKTAEALMFGKYIFGTKEAFEGYDLDFNRVGGICASKDEFVSILTRFINETQSVFNDYSRDIFKKKYETGIVSDGLKLFLESRLGRD